MRDIVLGKQNKKTVIAVIICIISIITGILFIGSATKLYPYGGDDQINNLGYLLETKDKNVFQLLVMDISQYCKDFISIGVPRYFPFGRMSYIEASLAFKSITAYRCWILIYLFLDLSLFAGLIFRLTDNRIVALLTMCLTPVMFNLNLTWHYNALYCYAALVFRTFLWMLLSLHFMINWIKKRNKLMALLCMLSMFIACLKYEMAYINVFLAVALAFSFSQAETTMDEFKNVIKYALPSIAATIAAFILYCGSHLISGAKTSTDTQVAIQPMSSLMATLKEMAASTPLVSAFYNDSFIKSSEFAAVDFICPIIIGLIATMLLMLYKDELMPERRWVLFRFGILVWLLPNLLISITVRFSKLDGWAGGWIVSAIGTYGVTLVFALLLMGLRKFMEQARVSSVEKYIAAILLFAVIVMGGAYSHAVARKTAEYGRGREAYEFVCDSLSDGIMQSVPEDKLIISDWPVWGDIDDAQEVFFKYYTGKSYDAFYVSNYDKSKYRDDSTYVYKMISDDDYLLSYVGKAEDADLQFLSAVDVYVDLSKTAKDAELCYFTIESGEEVLHSIGRNELLKLTGNQERGVVSIPGEHISSLSLVWM